MNAMIECLSGIDTSNMTLKEINEYLLSTQHAGFESCDSLRKSIKQHGMKFKKETTRKYNYESFYVEGMSYIELGKLSGAPKSCAYQWIRTMKRNRLKVEQVKTVPSDDVLKLALNCKWG